MPLSLIIVEDEALIAANLRFSLEDLGYTVLDTCHTYDQARAAFARHRPDLILLDINLGYANMARSGLALARDLIATPGAPPFVFVTAYNDPDTRRMADRLHPSGYLIKPVNNAALFAAIQTAFDYHRHHHPAPLPQPAPTTPPDYFYVKGADGQPHRLPWAEVTVLDATSTHVTLRAAAHPPGLTLRASLAFVLDHLVPEPLRAAFLVLHPTVCLNVAHITHFDEAFVQCGAARYENTAAAFQQLQARAR